MGLKSAFPEANLPTAGNIALHPDCRCDSDQPEFSLTKNRFTRLTQHSAWAQTNGSSHAEVQDLRSHAAFDVHRKGALSRRSPMCRESEPSLRQIVLRSRGARSLCELLDVND